MDDLPDLVVSWVLVAVMVTVPEDEGAVKRPLEFMVPLLADHLTLVLYPPVPWTVALHCEVEPVPTVEGLQLDATEVMDDELDWTVMDAEPDTPVFWVLVAVILTFATVAGAVNSPLELMAPALADQVTAEL